jgi:hypothetical protein
MRRKEPDAEERRRVDELVEGGEIHAARFAALFRQKPGAGVARHAIAHGGVTMVMMVGLGRRAQSCGDEGGCG